MRNGIRNITQTRLKISVRELVEQVMRQGDLGGAFFSSKRALEGILGHQVLQHRRGKEVRREVRVGYSLTDHPSGISLEIRGRIDGVFTEDGLYTVEEIKTTHVALEDLELEENGLHYAQAKMYGYLFAEQFDQQQIRVNLTYYQLKTSNTKVFSKSYSVAELKDYFDQVVNLYLESIRELYEWQEIRNLSIQSMGFPFPRFRQGQERFISEVAQAIREAHNLFAQAPTGLGKTISVLYPAIESLADGYSSKLFYLTARTTTREAPELVLELLRKNGLRLKSIVITAKEKSCLQDEMICNPDYCEYLFNYFGKINTALRDIFAQDHFKKENIESCARKHKVCPFELSLDLSLVSDCIICDYNYFFDPRVQLARYESESKQPYVYLVDEAHNLVERSRDMFSATLVKKDFLACKRLVNEKHYPELHDCLATLDSFLLDLRKNGFEENINESVSETVSGDLIDYLVDLLEPAEALLACRDFIPFRDTLLELYYRVSFFLKINQIAAGSDAYAVVMYRRQSDLTIKLLCLAATEMLQRKIEKGRATVFFSGTLTPSHYFSRLLGGSSQDQFLQLSSSFPPENRCLCLVDNLSTRYRDRNKTYDQIADYLSIYVQQKPGNYMIFFPSYHYLGEVYERCEGLIQGVTLIRQHSFMAEEERAAFIEEFAEGRDSSLAGFVVMGGVFGESIDLPGDRLTGAAIIGVGLPQVNLERNLIKQYHDSKSGNGFHYAYTYPGMNKVLQAAGRLIRTETDKGTLLLIDDRFANSLYRNLFPPEWSRIEIVRDSDALNSVLDRFWQSE